MQNKDHLFHLIKSLDKAEKRNFKVYTNRTSAQDSLYVQLFDVLDKMVELDEKEAKEEMGKISPVKYANIKRHLYNQLMKSLRLIYTEREIDIEIREQMDYAKILYTKGFYLEALRILEKTKSIVGPSNQNILMLEIVEFQKMIELRHITRSRQVKNKMEDLIHESEELTRKVASFSNLASLNIEIQGMYIKIGHIRDERDMFIVRNYFYSNLPNYKILKLSFLERVLVYQSFVWYHYMALNFVYCYKNARKWVDLFVSRPQMIDHDPGLYLRGLHYTLTSLFYLNHTKAYKKYYDLISDFEKNHAKSFAKSTQVLMLTYGMNAKLNYNFLTGQLKENIALEKTIQDEINTIGSTLDSHRIFIFKYKIGWSYIILRRYDEALERLHSIINDHGQKLRPDTFCYTKVLITICNFEMGEYSMVYDQLSNLRKYLTNNNEMNEVNKAFLSYLAYCSKNHIHRDEERLTQLKSKLEVSFADPYEKRAFIYFNYLDWANAQLEEITLDQYIKNKIVNGN